MTQQLTPYRYLLENVVKIAVELYSQLMQSAVDELGNPMPVAVRGRYSREKASFPQVTIWVEPGPINFYGGLNVMAETDDGQNFVGMVQAPGSVIMIKVDAREESERAFLVDTILSGTLTAFSAGIGGQYIQAAILQALGGAGIFVEGFGRVEFPEAVTDGSLPQGQYYPATLPMQCNILMSWTIPSVEVQHFLVQSSMAEAPGEPGSDGLTLNTTV